MRRDDLAGCCYVHGSGGCGVMMVVFGVVAIYFLVLGVQAQWMRAPAVQAILSYLVAVIALVLVKRLAWCYRHM
ncbi:MAG: hypothetical protein ABIH41_05790 [Nanoarchaeota archaeon]